MQALVAVALQLSLHPPGASPLALFDEIDAALDATYRAALAAMIERQSAAVDARGQPRTPTQFITTTFRPELVSAGNAWYGVTHRNKVSTVRSVAEAEAHRIIAEDQSRARQHAQGAEG